MTRAEEQALKAYPNIKVGEQKPANNIVAIWKDMRLEVGAQASGNRHEPNYSDNSTKLFSLNDIDEIIEKISEKQGSPNLANSAKTCKVEPKFKVGDTIHKIGEYIIFPMVIEEITDEYYVCDNKHVFISIKFQEQYELDKDELFDHRYAQHLVESQRQKSMIQWKGDNLKEVIDFTGKDINFDKWFKSFEEYEQYAQKHNGIFKLFNADGSHYEVPVGAWIVKTPDGCNVASKAIFKQKNAWSEEDERMIKEAIRMIEKPGSFFKGTALTEKVVSRLKSLKERCTWKPSDEQMITLEQWLKDYRYKGDARTCYPIFDSLYNDLKKLKG